MMALIKEDSPSDIVSIPSIDDDSSIAMIIEMEKEERELFYSIDVLTIPSKIAFFFSGCIFGSHLPYINNRVINKSSWDHQWNTFYYIICISSDVRCVC